MEEIQKEGQDPKENLELSEEEKVSEEEALKETSDDDTRSQIVEEYGLDEDNDSDLIDKIVDRETQGRKKLSTAIRQKRDWRDKAKAPKEQKIEDKPQPKKPEEDDFDDKLNKRLQERDIETLNLSDELKKEVEGYIKLNPGTSVKKAMDSPYIQFRKKEEDDKARAEEASIGGAHKAGRANLDFSEMSPGDFDRTTKEGREGYAQWKQWLKSR